MIQKKNQKLWGGRFKKETSKLMEQFNASIDFDRKLYPYDIEGSMAHAQMLAKQKIITQKDANKICQGLKAIRKKIDSGNFNWRKDREDIHLNIEAELTKNIGESGEKLHTARSRNDQVATDLRLYCRDQVRGILRLLREFQKGLLTLAKKQKDVILPGYTHLQRAQPIALGHYLLAYFEMSDRDIERLKDSLKRINILPLGSGALAGTTFPIDRQFVAKMLGFNDVAHNSLDAVSDRDFVIELLGHLSLVMIHLSRLAEEWILWTSQEFQFIELPENFCTGSSMMPQKVNPDALELIRGKAGRVIGDLQSMLVTLKGLPLTYNKDLQEDKEPLFDACETTRLCLEVLVAMLPQTRFNAEKMRLALAEGFVLATDLADYLVTRGISFREAHHIVGQVVAFCHEKYKKLEELSLEELQVFSQKIEAGVFDWLNYESSINRRSAFGGTAFKNVVKELKRAEQKIKKENFL